MTIIKVFILSTLFSFSAFAQSQITLNPGSSMTISAGETFAVTCSGTPGGGVAGKCTCYVGNRDKQEDIPCSGSNNGYALVYNDGANAFAIATNGCWGSGTSGKKSALNSCLQAKKNTPECQ